jgi:hypothetical protein
MKMKTTYLNFKDTKYMGRRKQGEGYVDHLSAWQYWWEYRDGTEGGMLWIDWHTGQVIDYDGAFDLPDYVKEELKVMGVDCDWD